MAKVGPSPHLTIQQPPARPAGPALHLSAAGPTLSSYARVVHQEPAIPQPRTPPAVELVDPSPATARATVNWFAHQRLPTQEIDKLVFATHEAFTNALIHGRPPTVLRLWAQPDRVTVTVTDTGTGPTDPLVGLLPPDPRTDPGPGLGLWLINQLVDVTVLTLTGDSYRTRQRRELLAKQNRANQD